MKHDPVLASAFPLSAAGVFSRYAHDIFAECYPETPHKLRHTLGDHPLLARGALAELGDRLPAASVTGDRGTSPLDAATHSHDGGPAAADAIIQRARTKANWAVLKNVEQDSAYQGLLDGVVGELRPRIEARTGRPVRIEGHVLLLGAGSVAPYHFDPEHTILIQLSGSKLMTLFPAGDPAFAPDEAHEECHITGSRQLAWRDEMAHGGIEWRLEPGDAVYIPPMAPHHVKVGAKPSVSLSIGWRSKWSLEEADARAFNAQLRRLGLKPRPPERWPAGNTAKALAWRAWRRFLQRRR